MKERPWAFFQQYSPTLCVPIIFDPGCRQHLRGIPPPMPARRVLLEPPLLSVPNFRLAPISEAVSRRPAGASDPVSAQSHTSKRIVSYLIYEKQ